MPFPARLAALGLLLASAATRAAPADDAIAALARQFDAHPVVMLGELHRSREIHAFLQQMLRTPGFVCRADDVVVEFGNARFQATADAYTAGKPVTEARLQRIWRETAVPFTWNAPMYRQVFITVREINMQHLCPHRVRIVLADPPLDWAKIRTARDYARWTDRDGSHARVIEREVLAKGHHALYLAGEYHALKAVPAELRDDTPTAAQQLQRRHPGALFVVVTVPSAEGAQALGLGEAPAFAVVDHAIADVTAQVINADTTVSTRPGPHGPVAQVAPDHHWPRLGDTVDGVLWLGGNHSVYPAPTIYLDPAYQQELRRRATIIKAYAGQDFLDVLDDLVREGEQARAAAP